MPNATPTKLKIEHLRMRGGCLITLSGVIDESFDKARFVSGAEGVVVIDLDDVRRITSYGVREWINALARIPHTWLGFVRARPALVAQFNMVTNFAADGQLLSLYLPYVCPESGKSFEVLVDVKRAHGDLAKFVVPATQCPDSATAAEFDDVPERYLSWVASHGPPEAPPMVEQLLSANAGEVSGGVRIIKEVLGDVTGLWLFGRLDEKEHFRRIADGLEGTLYVSCEGLSLPSEQGISNLLRFFKEVTVPLVLGGVPLDLGMRLAVDPVLSLTVTVGSVQLPARCPEHGVEQHRVDMDLVREAVQGRPLLLFCRRCEHVCTHEFSPSALATLASLPAEAVGDNILKLISVHEARVTDVTPSVSSTFAGPTGSVIMGRYQVVKPLGAGGMAEVFLARQSGVGGFERDVVIKRILPGLAVDQSFVDMFLQEARLAARLSHPNVVQIFDVGHEGGHYFIVMELVRGWDLNAVLRSSAAQRRAFPAALAARITADIARGLSAAHSHVGDSGRPEPIIHRDVSPHNVLVSTKGHVKLTDFGIAKAAGQGSLTPTSLLKGKASYMAPELIRSPKTPADVRIDLFAAGLIFYQLVTLNHPFRRDTELATFKALIQVVPEPPSHLVPALSAKVDAVCEKALAKDPAQRYSSARELEKDLEEIIAASGRGADAHDLEQWLKGYPDLQSMTAPVRDESATGSTHADSPRTR